MKHKILYSVMAGCLFLQLSWRHRKTSVCLSFCGCPQQRLCHQVAENTYIWPFKNKTAAMNMIQTGIL